MDITMSIGDWIGGAIKGVLSPVSSMWNSHQERKQAVKTGKQKLEHARITGQQQLDLTDAEWEAVSAGKQDSSWKDEYVTVIVTLPIPLLILGGILLAFDPNSQLLAGVTTGVREINSLEGNLSEMMMVVVYAAVGLKMWRGR